MVVAGLYGGATANCRILVAQALPGALALGAVLLAG
ncbi:putative membrane protein [Kitasatospora sp. MAA19]|nr:putative membrane protein [Kitasatospora sp. MAA19]